MVKRQQALTVADCRCALAPCCKNTSNEKPSQLPFTEESSRWTRMLAPGILVGKDTSLANAVPHF